jgi:hypothetical protein
LFQLALVIFREIGGFHLSTEMADDIGDGVEWLQWLLTNDLEAAGGHRPLDMVSVVRPA